MSDNDKSHHFIPAAPSSPISKMAPVTLRNLSKIYDQQVTAVNDVSVDIKHGEFVVLVGPSGCGKSTLLRMIAGLEDISSGDIYIGRDRINDRHPKDRNIAMVFQNYALYPHMNVFDNMAFGLKMRNTPKAQINRLVHEAAEILGLTDYLQRKPKELSGGQLQRVAVGRAIVRKPALFLFDEPLCNLDAKMRVAMRTELIKLHKNLDATMLYVTHDQVEAMSMGTRLIVMNNGSVQQIGAPLDIYNYPANMFVAGFIGTPPMNFLPVKITAQQENFVFVNEYISIPAPERILKQLPAERINTEVMLGIRPEHIKLHGKNKTAPKEGKISSQVEIVEPLGNEIHVTCKTGPNSLICRIPPDVVLQPGQNIELQFDDEHIQLYDKMSGKRIV